MSKTIFKQELRMNWRSVVAWSLAIAALLFVYGAMFSSFAKDAALFNQMMTKFPPELLAAFGMQGVDLTTVLGYFGLVFLFAQICLAVQAAGYGFGLVSVEERELTADFLLAKPVARPQILTSKLLAALTGLTITNAATWISSLAVVKLFKGDQSYQASHLFLLLLSIVVFQLVFLSLGLVISLLVKRVRSVTPYAMALAFGAYVLSVFGDLQGQSVLEILTPFKHFEPRHILQSGSYDVPLVMISVAAIVIALAASYILYARRDIPSVV